MFQGFTGDLPDVLKMDAVLFDSKIFLIGFKAYQILLLGSPLDPALSTLDFRSSFNSKMAGLESSVVMDDVHLLIPTVPQVLT